MDAVSNRRLPPSRPAPQRLRRRKWANEAGASTSWARVTLWLQHSFTSASRLSFPADGALDGHDVVGSESTSVFLTVVSTLFWSTGPNAEHAPAGPRARARCFKRLGEERKGQQVQLRGRGGDSTGTVSRSGSVCIAQQV